MEKQITLIVAPDPQDGELGIMIDGSQTNELINSCRNSLLMAHDITEHLNGLDDLGTSTDEFKALGVIEYGRGFGNEIHLNIDVTNTWRYMANNEETLEDVGECLCDGLEQIEEYVEQACWPYSVDIDEPADIRRLTVNLMCLGYNQAKELYGTRANAYDAYHRVKQTLQREVFEPITTNRSFYSRDVEFDRIEGRKFLLTYDTEGTFARLETQHAE